MRVEKDFEELLKLFNKYKVRYCVIGAFALAFHAQPRYTKDLDILIDPTTKNGTKILKALHAFGFKSLNLSEDDFSQKDRFIQLGYEPLRVDLITSIQGLPFQQVWKNKSKGVYGKQKIYFIGLGDFITSKENANRKQDLADLDILKKVKKQ